MIQWLFESGKFANACDYVRGLIRQDQERAVNSKPCRMRLPKAWKSGVSDKSMRDILRQARKQAALQGQ